MVFSMLHSVSSKSDHVSNEDERPVTPGSHPIELSINIESPPCVMYGNATESSGALLSGLLNLKVKDPYKDNGSVGRSNLGNNNILNVNTSASLNSSSSQSGSINTSNTKRKSGLFTTFSSLSASTSNNQSINTMNSTTSNFYKSSSSQISNQKILEGYTKVPIVNVTLSFVQTVYYHKPFLPDSQQIQTCNNCRKKITNMRTWNIQTEIINKSVGTHSYPFSYLIPGSVPATCRLGEHSETQVKYELIASASYVDPKNKNFNVSRPNKKDFKLLKLIMPIPITRSIPRGPDKNSLRVFPPTELTAAAVLPNVIYPKSTFPLELKLDGVSSGDRRWRMRKLAWRIEETTKVRGYSCLKHKPNLTQLEEDVRKRELERSKKPVQVIKRYGDIGPQIKVAVASPDNLPMNINNILLSNNGYPIRNTSSNNVNENRDLAATETTTTISRSDVANNPSSSRPFRRRNARGMQDTDDDDDGTNQGENLFIHPSDDALRQEILQQQRRIREEQLKKELAKNNSMLFTEEVRVISKGEVKNGWKTDFDNNGKIELVTDIDCMSLNSGVGNPIIFSSTSRPYIDSHKNIINVACDVQDPNLGIYVSHTLAVEIVVAEETLQYANGQPINKSKNRSQSTSKTSVPENDADQRLAELSPLFANMNAPKARPVTEEGHSTLSLKRSISGNSSGSKHLNGQVVPKIVSVPTGAARVLRMQFRLNITERSGLGISWDEEVPPIYQDVKQAAPPTYETTVAVLPSYTVDENEEARNVSEQQVSGLIAITPPPMAHHSSSNQGSTLSAVQSPQLENIISVQGRIPYRNSVLTPYTTTQDLGVRNISSILNTDRIAQ